jgi:threonyl-tRNA synthetase
MLTSRQYDYAEEVKNKLWDVGLYSDVDNGTDTLNKKIRNGELAQYNFICGTLRLLCPLIPIDIASIVVGEEEMKACAVNVRNRDDVGQKTRAPTLPLDEVVMKLVNLKATRSLENKI